MGKKTNTTLKTELQKQMKEDDYLKLVERLNLATHAAQMGIWDWDIQKNELVWDDQMYQLYGLRPGDFGGAYEAWLNGVYPDDREPSDEASQMALRGEKEYDTEFRVLWPDGSVHWLKANGQVFRDEKGNPLRMVGVNYDITARRQAEERLKESEEYLRLGYDAGELGIWKNDLQTGAVEFDERARIHYGFDTLHTTLSEVTNRIHPDDLARVGSEIEAATSPDGIGKFATEYRVVHADGSVHWLAIGVQVLFEGEGAQRHSVVGYGTTQDITARKQAEIKLSESEQKFSSLFNKSVYATTLSRLPDGVLVDVNEAFEQDFGYTRQEAIGKTSLELGFNPDVEGRARILAEIKEHGSARNHELPLRTKSNETRIFSVNIDMVDIDGQKYILNTSKDITEQKQAEKQIIQMKRLYATLSQVNQTIVRVKDHADLYQSICDVSTKFGEFALAWIGILDAETGEIKPVAASGLDLEQWPFPQVNIHKGDLKNGLAATAMRTSKIITSDDVAIDERTKQSQASFANYDYHSTAIVPFQLRGTTIGILSLVSSEAELFKAQDEILLLREMGGDISFALDTLETEKEHRQAEEKIEKQNERLNILRKIDLAILSADSLENIVSVALDHIRELIDCRRANLTLIDWKTNELVIFEVSTVGETSIPAGRRLPLAQFEDIIQTLSQNQPILFSDYRTIADPRPGIQSLMRDGLLSTCSLPLLSKGGLIGMFSMHSDIPGFFDEGKIALGSEVANQVTIAIVQMQLTEALTKNEERLRLSLHAARQGLYDLNVQTGESIVNRGYAEMLGYDPESFTETNAAWIERLHPDDQAITAKAYTDYINGLLPEYRVEFRQKTKQGDWKWILSLGSIVEYDAEGKPLRMMGTHTDINERKEAEKQIVQMKRLYATLSQVNQTIVRVKDHADLYQSICDVSTKFGEFALAWIGILDAETGDIKPVAASGLELAQWPFPQINIHEGTFKNGLVATAMRTSKVVTSDDVAVDERTKPSKTSLDKYDYHSAAIVPFQLRGTTIGILSLVSNEVDLFNAQDEILLLKEMGGDISFALDMMETEAERRQTEDALKESETRFSKMFFTNPVSQSILSTITGQTVEVNDACCRLYEYSHEELIGTDPGTLDLWANRAEQLDVLEELQRTGRLLPREVTIRPRSGELRTIFFSVEQISWKGEPCLITSSVDITERTKAEYQIKRQIQRLNGLHTIDQAISSSMEIEATLNIVLQQTLNLLNADAASILLFNDAQQRLDYATGKGFRSASASQAQIHIGVGLAGQVGQSRKLLHIPDLVQIGDKFLRAKMLKEDQFVEYFGVPLIAKDSLKGVLEIFNRTPIHPDSEWLNFLEILGGQTAIAIDNALLFEGLQRSNADLEQRVKFRTTDLLRVNAELEHANRTKDEFLANMSHELRTPLSGILGLTESLQLNTYGQLNEKQSKVLNSVEASGRHLLELINDILDLSKIEAGKFDVYPEMLDIEGTCRASLMFVKEQAAKKSILLEYQDTRDAKSVFADSRRLKQILVNLLSNAVKFTPEKGKVTLAVNTDPEKGQIHFSVTDTGIGIAKEDLERLFSPFTQVDSRLNRQYEGTGLGLVLVLRLAEMHGGNVRVETEPGKGSRFTVSLPWQSQVSAPTETKQINTEAPIKSAAPNSQGIVLLVEDTASNVETIGDYLQFKGYTLVVASNGIEALVKTEEINPDLILMDIQMPVMDGLEATRRLRADPRFASTPIIALTALAMTGDRERCMEAGATDYLSKPVSLKELTEKIRNLLQ